MGITQMHRCADCPGVVVPLPELALLVNVRMIICISSGDAMGAVIGSAYSSQDVRTNRVFSKLCSGRWLSFRIRVLLDPQRSENMWPNS